MADGKGAAVLTRTKQVRILSSALTLLRCFLVAHLLGKEADPVRPRGAAQPQESHMPVPARCFRCGGPFHQATGHVFVEFDIAYCGACYRHFLAWYKGHTRRKWGGSDFYAEAATSIRAGVFPAAAPSDGSDLLSRS